MRQAKALIRLRICAGWSEPLLFAYTTLLEISCGGPIIVNCFVCNDVFLDFLLAYFANNMDQNQTATIGAV